MEQSARLEPSIRGRTVGTGLAIHSATRLFTALQELDMTASLRRILFATTLPVFALPAASRAGGLDQAIDTCVKAFVAQSLPKEQPIVVEKRSSKNQALDSRTRTYRISLTATGRSSGREFAKGTCVVDRKGEIIAL
jgi:hypothetical protein